MPTIPLSDPIGFEARHWDHDADFHDVLAGWLRRAPYLLASVALHAVLALVVAGIGFLRSREAEPPVLQVAAPPPAPEIVEPPKPPEPQLPDVIDPEPVLRDVSLAPAEDDTPLDVFDDFSIADLRADWEEFVVTSPVGIGPGSPYGSRRRGGATRGGGPQTEAAVQEALQWLADHQTPDDGYWDADEFMFYDQLDGHPRSDGAGNPVVDVGLTGLATLAFLGTGSTMSSGPWSPNIQKGVSWLRHNQRENGLFGDEVGNATLYNHALATMAVGEAHYFGRSPVLRRNVEKAVTLIVNARNPYNAWRYSLEPNGDNDSSITGWMVFALKTAQEGGIPVSKSAFDGAGRWFETMTDPGTGRTGYAMGAGGGIGSRPSRPEIYLERFPPERSEALTAVALLSREFMTDGAEVSRWRDHPDYPALKKQADLILGTLPVWDVEGGTCDLYYWYYATFAMYQWGGQHWKTWQKAIEKALVPHQRRDGNFAGSWDPVGPWGREGGRVYSTALGAIILEVYYRYAPILGGR